MAFTLNSLRNGKRHKPRKTLLYGTEGIGKSTWAAQWPEAVCLNMEDGLEDINCVRTDPLKRFSDVMEYVTLLAKEQHGYQTVVFDTADALEMLIWEHLCNEKNCESIEEVGGGYGKGYVEVLPYWRKFLSAADYLNSERGLHIVLVAHAKIEKFQDPERDSYDRYSPKLHKHAGALLKEWATEILFATYKIHTKTTDAGFGKKEVKAIGSGDRVLRTRERPTHIAKNRLQLPDEMPLDFRAYAEYLKPADTAKTEKG